MSRPGTSNLSNGEIEFSLLKSESEYEPSDESEDNDELLEDENYDFSVNFNDADEETPDNNFVTVSSPEEPITLPNQSMELPGPEHMPNPFRPEFTDLDYADVDYASYGPINYKAASIFAAQKKNEPEDLL